MPETKRLLVAFDPSRPNAPSSDFLIPWNREGKLVLLGLNSGLIRSIGLVIFVGRPVSENDIFAKLVDAGTFIGDVEGTLTGIRNYIDLLGTLKIGNVVRLVPSSTDSGGYEFELVAATPSSAASKS